MVGSKTLKEAGEEKAKNSKQNGELTIWHWNINGVRAVLNSGKLVGFIKEGKFC